MQKCRNGEMQECKKLIEESTDEALLRELESEASSDALEFGDGVLSRIDANAALRSTEGNVDDRALVRHQSCQRLHLVARHVATVSNTFTFTYKAHLCILFISYILFLIPYSYSILYMLFISFFFFHFGLLEYWDIGKLAAG